jgi:hypothetical protein
MDPYIQLGKDRLRHKASRRIWQLVAALAIAWGMLCTVATVLLAAKVRSQEAEIQRLLSEKK